MTTVATVGPTAFSPSAGIGHTSQGEKIALSNRYLDWDLLVADGKVRSAGLHNKLSGRYSQLTDSKEFALIFSQAQARVEIPWWNFELGPDNDSTPPKQEKGYRAGYHLPTHSGDEKWAKTENPLFRQGFGGRVQPIFDGYAWFRQNFKLPETGQGQPIVFCLGGYTQEDWNEYWAYVNGMPIGHWTRCGRWRTPEEIILWPDSVPYQSLGFGEGRRNLLALRMHRYDKRFAGLNDAIWDRFVFDARLYDQFIAVGRPYLHVSDFELVARHRESEEDHYIFELTNRQESLQLILHYELEEFTRRKWLELKNLSGKDRLLLDIVVDDFLIQGSMTEGGYGLPVIVGEEIFCAVEHPAGLNQGISGRVRLSHLPGTKVPPGGTFKSKVSIIGVAPPGGGRQQFVDRIQSRSPRKNRLVSIYDPLFRNNSPDDPCWTMNDRDMLATLDILAKWQKQGVTFDYYVWDWGWQDPAGDLKRPLQHCYPEGPDKVVARVKQLGMKWGLWFAGGAAELSIGLNPATKPSRSPFPGGGWAEYAYRDGYPQGGGGNLCIASEPFFSMLRDAILYHVRHYDLKFFKLDAANYYCNGTEHGHLPGKYSGEANYDAVIELLRTAREAAPDIYTMLYWGIRSPFFALYGDSIFESRYAIESVVTSDYPALFFVDSMIVALDQANHLAEFIPPVIKDSLGLWLSDVPVGNYVAKERWREAIVMDLGRGNLLFPQIWGDVSLLNDDDVAFLARLQELARKNAGILLKRNKVLGDPWKNEPYGYAYFHGGHGFLFMNNLHFDARLVALQLGEKIGLRVSAGTKLRLLERFPEQRELLNNRQAVFEVGDTVEAWLRPFEAAMWEIVPESAGEAVGWAARDIGVRLGSYRLDLQLDMVAPEAEIVFGEPQEVVRASFRRRPVDELRRAGYRKQVMVRRTVFPPLGDAGHVLGIVLRLRKNGQWWRYEQLADLIQIKARVGGQPTGFEAVPNVRQTEEGQWCPWLVFKTRTSSNWSGQELWFAINAYLPRQVECELEAWVVPEWWVQ